MNIEFVSPEAIITVQGMYVELYTIAGFIAVYQDHAPLIAPLVAQKDIVLYSENSSQRHFIAHDAIAHIERTGVTIIASHIHEKSARPNSNRISL